MSLIEKIEELNSSNSSKALKLKFKLKIFGLILLIIGFLISISSLITFLISGYQAINEYKSIIPSIISIIVLLPGLLSCGIGFYLYKISTLIEIKNVS